MKTRADYDLYDLYLLVRWARYSKRELVGPVIYEHYTATEETILQYAQYLRGNGLDDTASNIDIEWEEEMFTSLPMWLVGDYVIVLDSQNQFITILENEG